MLTAISLLPRGKNQAWGHKDDELAAFWIHLARLTLSLQPASSSMNFFLSPLDWIGPLMFIPLNAFPKTTALFYSSLFFGSIFAAHFVSSLSRFKKEAR
jgi:hypothetical protein